MRRRFFGCLLFLFFTCVVRAQDKWDLQRLVAYAIDNNISVKQANLQIQYSELELLQNRSSQIPTLNFGLNAGLNLGRRENPSTGILEDQNLFSTSTNLQSGVTIFNWFSIKNSIAASRLTIEADKAYSQKVQDDVALNVAVAYLQILLAKEQTNIADLQVHQTLSQLELTRKKVNAGALPELNAAELEAQLARDSSALITSQSAIQQSLLQMKALLNLDASLPFDVATPPVDKIPIETLADLQPEAVYNLALKNLSQQQVTPLRIQSAMKLVESAKGSMYPNISAFGNINSSYVYFRNPIYNQVLSGYQNTGLRVDAGNGNFFNVQTPNFTQGTKTGQYFTPAPFGQQLSANFGQGLGIGIQVPIFNGRSARSAWERSKLNVQQLQLQDQLEKQTLKQDIYRAYTDAIAAIEKFNASQKSVAATQKAFDFAQKRYDLNLVSTYDLVNTQNNLLRARLEMVSAQYDFVFKMKLLEFYKGQGLRL
ncbi:MAG: TolC family protein [Chitinophagaceae bacterium]